METLPEIKISTDKSLLDIFVICQFLKSSYWASQRTEEDIKTSIENSICYGMYLDGKQIGFIRVLTDKIVFAYLMDVFILEEHRGNGYSKLLLNTILNSTDFQKVGRWVLITKDAHWLYTKLGFTELAQPERFMERRLK
ncbi:MAG: GNAT superfamily N-acetyltransferase [Polaribacter sp.]|jgi:GNAT superfamily N-acetyltransferase